MPPTSAQADTARPSAVASASLPSAEESLRLATYNRQFEFQQVPDDAMIYFRMAVD
ncbi:MAG TPA: hypothetical protein VK302_05855 [Terriglobales bacterium]|nr:hypothetical protein [Terriglobales bacterium]